jgi:hypothetical protein
MDYRTRRHAIGATRSDVMNEMPELTGAKAPGQMIAEFNIFLGIQRELERGARLQRPKQPGAQAWASLAANSVPTLQTGKAWMATADKAAQQQAQLLRMKMLATKAPSLEMQIAYAGTVTGWLERLGKHNPVMATKVTEWAATKASGSRQLSEICRSRGWGWASFWRHIKKGQIWIAGDLRAKGAKVF